MANTNNANQDLSAVKDISIDIVFGGLGKAGEAVSSIAQQGLLDAFKAASKLEDLAARLVIPIQLLTVTGAKVVTAHGYDAYKITIAIRSDDPNAVAKEIFSTGIGLAVTPLGTIFGRLTFAATGPIGSALGGAGFGLISGAGASLYAGKFWEDTLKNTAAGQWAIGQMTDSFGIGVKINRGSSNATSVLADIPPTHLAPSSALVFDPTDQQVKVIFNQNKHPTIDPDVAAGANTYTVQNGDSLWKIAQSNGWNLGALKAANPQLSDPNFILAGQRINGIAPVDHHNATQQKMPTDFYNANGQKTADALFSPSGELTNYRLFNDKGEMTQDQHFKNGLVTDVENFTNGVRTSVDHYNSNLQKTATDFYNPDGQKKTADALFGPSGTQTNYRLFNDKGQMTQDQHLTNGLVTDAVNFTDGVRTDIVYYDPNQKKTADALFSPSGEQTNYRLFNDKGQMTQDQHFTNGHIADVDNFTDGVRATVDHYNAHQHKTATDFYNANGQKTADALFGPSGGQTNYRLFDDKGYMTQDQQMVNGKFVTTVNYTGGIKTSDALFDSSGQQTNYRLFDGKGLLTQDQELKNGVVVDAINYKDGVKTNTAFYDATGQMIQNQAFKNNVLHDATNDANGRPTLTTFYNPAGQKMQDQQFSISGKVNRATNYTNGVKTDMVFYNADGTVTGQEQYRSDGTVKYAAQFGSDGLLLADSTYNEAGQLAQGKEYRHGVLTAAMNYTNGAETSRTNYRPDGTPVGSGTGTGIGTGTATYNGPGTYAAFLNANGIYTGSPTFTVTPMPDHGSRDGGRNDGGWGFSGIPYHGPKARAALATASETHFRQGKWEGLGQLGMTSINPNAIAAHIDNNGHTILNDSILTWENRFAGDIAGRNLMFDPAMVDQPPSASGNADATTASALDRLIQSMAAFAPDGAGATSFTPAKQQNLKPILLAASLH